MYIIVKEDTISHEGDQRSREFPDHGYPAWTETISRAEVYESYIAFVAEVTRLTNAKIKFRAFNAKQYDVQVETYLKLNLDESAN